MSKLYKYINEQRLQVIFDKFTKLLNKSGFVPSTYENLNMLDYPKQDSRERNIFHHSKEYWVVIKDSNMNWYNVTMLSPYVYIEDDTKLFGWGDKHNTWDNYFTPIHDDDFYVIMFLPK